MNALGVARRSAAAVGLPLAVLWVLNRQPPVGDVIVSKSDLQWRTELSEPEYYVLRQRGTERAGTSSLNKEKREGTYLCRGCDYELFPSSAKFDSGTGWPSFYDVIYDDDDDTKSERHEFGAKSSHVKLTVQPLYNMTGDLGARECRCRRCGGHLGHVFSDGALWGTPTGKRYCMNGVALRFISADTETNV